MDQREINEKRYEIAASQTSSVMLVGLFSNLAIFAITAFAELSSGVQTDCKVIVCLVEAFFFVFAMGVFGDTAAYVKDVPANEDSTWTRNARKASPEIFMAISAVGIIALCFFQIRSIGA